LARDSLNDGLHPNIGANIVADIDVRNETFIRFVLAASGKDNGVGKDGRLVVSATGNEEVHDSLPRQAQL